MKLLILLLFLLLATSAQATVYWASTSGSGATCGTTGASDPGSGYTTIAKGLTCVSTGGDVLNVKSGTYNYTIDTDVTPIASGNAGNPIRIVSVDGARLAIFRSIATREVGVNKYLVFDGFKTTGATLNDQAAVVYNTSNFVTHTNFEIDGAALAACTGSTPGGGCGEGLGAFGDNSTYSNGEIHNIHAGENDAGGNSGHGIYLHHSNNVIDNLYVHDVGGQGIQVYNSGHTDVSNNVVKNSRWQNTKQSSGIGMSAIYLGNGTGNVAYNNVIYGSTYVGIQIGTSCNNCAAYNNTLVGVTNQAFEIYAGASGTITLKNNLLSGNGSTFVDNHGSVTHDHNGCAVAGTWCDVVGSLNFVNPGSSDYRLLTGSVAIDAGTNLGSTYSPDLAGVARPSSGPWEIGAYETGSTFWVSTSGTDGQCTNSATPQTTGAERTIAGGIACLGSGDTLNIRTGTYNETINRLQVPSGTSWNTATTIQAYTGENVIITGTGGAAPLAFQSPGTGITKEYIILKGTGTYNLIFDPASAANVPAVSIGGGSNGGTLQYIRLDGVMVRNVATSSAIFIGDGAATPDAHHIEVINSTIHDWTSTGTPPQNHGIYVASGDNLIENNLIYNGHGYGIHFFNSGGGNVINNNRIRRNIVHDVCLDPGGCNGILVAYGNNIEVSNNLVYNIVNGGDGSGIGTGPGSTNALVYGNTVYNTDYWGLNTYGSTGTLATNNIFSNVNSGGGGTAFSADGTGVIRTTNLCSTTQVGYCAYIESSATTFVTPGSNFHIKAGSAAINAGTNLGSTYSPDLAGVARPTSGPWEIGAYEYIAGGPIVTITGPTASATYNTNGVNTVAISGTSDLASGTITYTCDRCTTTSGSAFGVLKSWILPTLTLKAGVNIITVIATTAGGLSSSDTLVVTYSPTFPGNSLVAAYAFDEGSGITAADTSGNSNTGTLINSPAWAGPSGGRYGNAVIFNGIDQYVRVLDSNSLDLTQSFTLSLWVQPTAAGNDFRSLMEKNSSGGAPPPFQFFASVLGYCGTGGIGGFISVNGSSGPAANVCTPNPLQVPGSWTHLALTYDGANLKLYRQGVLIDTTPITGYIEPSTGILQIAASEFGEYFEGLIDEVRIYNFALPLTGGANTVFGNNCTRADAINIATASIIGDANCPISAPVSPLPIKIGASATGLKLGAGATIKFGSTSGAQ